MNRTNKQFIVEISYSDSSDLVWDSFDTREEAEKFVVKESDDFEGLSEEGNLHEYEGPLGEGCDITIRDQETGRVKLYLNNGNWENI